MTTFEELGVSSKIVESLTNMNNSICTIRNWCISTSTNRLRKNRGIWDTNSRYSKKNRRITIIDFGANERISSTGRGATSFNVES